MVMSLFKKALYIPIALAGIYLGPAQAQVKTTETESFDGSITRSYTRDNTDKWSVGSQYLEAKDFDPAWGDKKKSGFTRLHFNDKTYDIIGKNMAIQVSLNKNSWGSDSDYIGLVFCGDPIGGTYYSFEINSHPDITPQFAIRRQSPSFNHTYIDNQSYSDKDIPSLDDITSTISKTGMNTLAVIYSSVEYTDAQSRTISTGWNFYINSTKIKTPVGLPALNGYPGAMLYDSMGANDPSFSSTTYFDDFIVIYDSGGGGQANLEANNLEAKLSTPHLPGVFLRGDSNNDNKVDISDAINTLGFLFTSEGNITCKDAADTNDDGSIDISDAVYTLLHIFEGRFILPPNKGGKGMDLTSDNLGCETRLQEWAQ
ncbi:hypothetical protein HYV49_02905 [Candidatus Pacearchaeota archaeon]|nr:hypothetical protein [Candidatus Pacearchaeota archaeon]